MGEVINLDEQRPRLTGPARCLDCKHEWEAVAPEGTTWLQCPNCLTMKGRFIYFVEKGRYRWVCNCGNDLFFITPEGTYCPCCGVWQVGF